MALAGCGRSESAETASRRAPADTPARYGNSGGDRVRTVAVGLPPAPRPTGPLPAGTACVSGECHASLATSRHVHAPAAAGNCEACHAPDAGGHRYPLLRPGRAGCEFCHSVSGARQHEHAALTEGGCQACHQSHASAANHLLNDFSVERVCGKCHATPWKKYAHAPFASGQCTLCHQPHQADGKGLLRSGPGPGHCTGCHEAVAASLKNAAVVHQPARENCGHCHGPHTTDHPHLLKEAPGQACLSCHQDLGRRIAGARVSHDAVFTGEACGNCHQAHAGDRPRLLRDRADRLCLRCHNQALKTSDGRTIADMSGTLSRKYLHGPVRSGDCQVCHSVHGSAHARLLTEAFPAKFYAGFDLTHYALCFRCHSRELVLREQTSELTGFRDGTRNLHYLHVHRDDKGRSCKTCHDMHGSDLPRHMAEAVPFEGSGWAMPLGFEKAADGGRCAPGCHEPKTYRRSTGPATAPAAVPSPTTAPRGVP